MKVFMLLTANISIFLLLACSHDMETQQDLSNSEGRSGLSKNSENTIVSKPSNDEFETLASYWETYAIVTDVIDGITIMIEKDGISAQVRYLGVQIKNMESNKGLSLKSFLDSTRSNRSAVLGEKVLLVRSNSINIGTEGSLLRYVYLDNELINLKALKDGYAVLSETDPPHELSGLFKVTATSNQHANSATKQKIPEPINQDSVLWGTLPKYYDINKTVSKCDLTNTNIPAIKGIIDRKTGAKHYYMPGHQTYNENIIDNSKGDRWFCTESEARAMGWTENK